MKCCHSCRLDYKRTNKANEWEAKFSERQVAQHKRFCPSCRRDLTWWWFVYLPVTAEEVARYLARGERRRLAEQKTPVQLED